MPIGRKCKEYDSNNFEQNHEKTTLNNFKENHDVCHNVSRNSSNIGNSLPYLPYKTPRKIGRDIGTIFQEKAQT